MEQITNQSKAILIEKLNERLALIELEHGQRVVVEWKHLTEVEDGKYSVPFDINAALESANLLIPVIAEDFQIEKRPVEVGKVRISKGVRERLVQVEEPLMQDNIEIERVTINEYLSEPAQVRHEGDTMIIPVMEEVVVVEKKLVLREEIRVTKHQVQKEEAVQVTLKSEEVSIERLHNEEG